MFFTALIAAYSILPSSVADWQVESAWITNITGSQIVNGSSVTLINPWESSAGKNLFVTDSFGVATSKHNFTPYGSKLANYDAKFKIRYIGGGSTPTARSFAATVSVSQVGNAGSTISGVTQLPQGFCAVSNIGWGSVGYDVLHYYGTGAIDFQNDRNTLNPIHQNATNPDYELVSGTAGTAIYGTDSGGPYWILTIAGGFAHDIEIISHEHIEGIQGTSELGTKFTVTSFNNSPID